MLNSIKKSEIDVAFIVSTNGSVLRKVIESKFFNQQNIVFFTDRKCGFEEWAKNDISLNSRLFELHSKTPKEFFEKLEKHFQDFNYTPKWFILFYLDYPSYEFRKKFQDKLINLHPSILPAFKGFDVDYQIEHNKPKFVGSTVEIIRHRMDNGIILAQSVSTYDSSKDYSLARHKVYEQQICLVIQLLRWIKDNRILIEGDYCNVVNAEFKNTKPAFSPNIDNDIINEIIKS